MNETLRNEFARDGFIRLPAFIRGPALEVLLSNVNRFIAEVAPGMPPEQVFHEDKADPSSLKQLQHMEEHDAWFHQLITTGPIHQLAETLLNGRVVAKNLQYFNKPPGIGKPTPPHQDGFYFMLDPCEALTIWLALDPVDEENGCVRYVRGSHQRGMRPHGRTQTLGFSQGIPDYPQPSDRVGEVAIIAEPGDLLAHDALTIHRADGNRSITRSRRALGFIFYSERAREDTAAHAAYQQRLADEWRADGKI